MNARVKYVALRIALLFLVVTLGIGFTALLQTHFYSLDTAQFFIDIRNRFQIDGGIDGIAPAFKQSSQNTCGAAAMTYLLTKMGDLVFEANFIQAVPLKNSVGYSFADMALYARMRGFQARGYSGDADSLPYYGEPPVIAHLNHGHYVVVLFQTESMLTLFDPAHGKTLTLPKDVFMKNWSGRFLRVTTEEYADYE